MILLQQIRLEGPSLNEKEKKDRTMNHDREISHPPEEEGENGGDSLCPLPETKIFPLEYFIPTLLRM